MSSVGKTYLSATDRQNFILLSAAGTATVTVLEQSAKHLPKGVAADVKRSLSFLRRALSNWIEPIDEKSRKTLLKQQAGVRLDVISDMTKRAGQEDYVKYIRDVREAAYQDGGRDFVYDMAEHTLAMVCSRCDGKPKSGCALYAAYQHFQIEFWNANHPECEYAGVGTIS